MSDEAHFTLSRTVNKQNCRLYGTENPHIIHEVPLYAHKLTVWSDVCANICGISASLSLQARVLVVFVASVHARAFWKALFTRLFTYLFLDVREL